MAASVPPIRMRVMNVRRANSPHSVNGVDSVLPPVHPPHVPGASGDYPRVQSCILAPARDAPIQWKEKPFQMRELKGIEEACIRISAIVRTKSCAPSTVQ